MPVKIKMQMSNTIIFRPNKFVRSITNPSNLGKKSLESMSIINRLSNSKSSCGCGK